MYLESTPECEDGAHPVIYIYIYICPNISITAARGIHFGPDPCNYRKRAIVDFRGLEKDFAGVFLCGERRGHPDRRLQLLLWSIHAINHYCLVAWVNSLIFFDYRYLCQKKRENRNELRLQIKLYPLKSVCLPNVCGLDSS